MRARLAAAALAVFALRFFLAAWLGLGDDEAYYWHWAQRLSWSYFDHPPLTAWLIRAGTALLGHHPFAVRLPGLLCHAASAWFLWRLGRALFGEEVAAATVLLYLLAPLYLVGGLLMVPDAPLATAWLGAAWWAWRFSLPGAGRREALALGLCLGFGLLAKLPILLLTASLPFALPLARWKEKLRLLPLVLGPLALAALPLLHWNLAHDLASFRFHLVERQAGGLSFARWLRFLASQGAALGPPLLLLCVAAVPAAASRLGDPRWRLLLALSLPTLLLFSAQALFADFKPHWPAPAYPLLLLAAVAWLQEKSAGLRRGALAACFAFALAVSAAALACTVHPLAPKLARAFGRAELDPKHDPSNELYGWEELAARLRQERVKAPGVAFLASHRYQLVGQLAFAMNEEAWRLGEARDHYAFAQAGAHEALRGHGAFFVADNRFPKHPLEAGHFTACHELEPLEVRRSGEKAREFRLWRCEGYTPR